MTRVLPSGLEAKTGTIPEPLAPHLTHEDRQFVLLGPDVLPFITSEAQHPGTRMVEAVLAVSEALQHPDLINDSNIRRYKEWLATFDARVRGWGSFNDENTPVIRFMPPKDAPGYVEDLEIDLADPGPQVEVLGHPLTRADLIYFTDYLMTNSGPIGAHDSRYSFIRGIRIELGLESPS